MDLGRVRGILPESVRGARSEPTAEASPNRLGEEVGPTGAEILPSLGHPAIPSPPSQRATPSFPRRPSLSPAIPRAEGISPEVGGCPFKIPGGNPPAEGISLEMAGFADRGGNGITCQAAARLPQP
ncbi:hypothetical protein GCM10029976_036510 [Kribbella albertanoniae]